jgi:hypothetical protein
MAGPRREKKNNQRLKKRNTGGNRQREGKADNWSKEED